MRVGVLTYREFNFRQDGDDREAISAGTGEAGRHGEQGDGGRGGTGRHGGGVLNAHSGNLQK